jgi:dCMP deaminase
MPEVLSDLKLTEGAGLTIDRGYSHKWDQRFMDVAELVSTWSKDPSTKCGAVIVKREPNGKRRIVGTGYNGFPAGCDDSEEVYADRELKYARVIHAEQNAILNAEESLYGTTIYTWPPGYGPSCDRCSAHIIQAGITEVVYQLDESDFAMRWKDAAERGLDMYREAGVKVRVHLPEKEVEFVRG